MTWFLTFFFNWFVWIHLFLCIWKLKGKSKDCQKNRKFVIQNSLSCFCLFIKQVNNLIHNNTWTICHKSGKHHSKVYYLSFFMMQVLSYFCDLFDNYRMIHFLFINPIWTLIFHDDLIKGLYLFLHCVLPFCYVAVFLYKHITYHKI